MKALFMSRNPAHAWAMKPVAEELSNRGWSVDWLDGPKSGYDIYVCSRYTLIEALPPKLRRKCFWIMHGVNTGCERYHPMHGEALALLVAGSYWVKVYAKGKPVMVGYPKMDVFFKEDKPKPLDMPHPAVLYAPTHPGWGGSSVFKSLPEILEMRWTGTLIVKPHPFHYGRHVQYQEAMRRARENVVWADPESDIRPLYATADVLVSDVSGCIYDFMLLRKPTIQLTNVPDRSMLFEPGLKCPLEELWDLAETASRNPKFTHDRKENEWVGKLFYKPDGYSAERASDIIENLGEKNEA